MTKNNDTAPQNAEALEAFDALINLMNEHCETYSIETLEQDYGDDVTEAIKNIRAALNQPRTVIEWQPIETAPVDGTRFIAFGPNGLHETWWGCVDQPEYEKGLYWWCSDTTEYCDGPFDAPTHWMPLPEQPAEAHWQQKIGECLG